MRTFHVVTLCEETDCDGCGKIIKPGAAWQTRQDGKPTLNACSVKCMREAIEQKAA